MIITQKRIEILMIIDNFEKSIYSLSKKLNITYAQLYKILKDFEKIGIIECNKKGRGINIKLTKKGEYTCNISRELYLIFSNKK